MAFSSGRALVVCLQEPMPGEKSLEYAIQATASVWMPFEQVHNVESGDVDFGYFGMAPWDAGGMHHDVTVVNADVVPTSDYARIRWDYANDYGKWT